MIDLPAVYRDLARSSAPDELERLYRDALRRGEPDLPDGDPGTRPIGLLADAMPGLAGLRVAVYAIHVLPHADDSPEGDALHREMLDLVDRASAGALLRCHLAMDAELTASRRELPAGEEITDDWLPIVFESADSVLHQLTHDAESIEGIAEDVIGWLAHSIQLLDEHDPNRVQAITDALARLLALCMFAQTARRHF